MSRSANGTSSLRSLPMRPRTPVRGSQREWVRLTRPERRLPVLVEPVVDGLRLKAWAEESRDYVEELLSEHRALLFRGFTLDDRSDFHGFVQVTSRGDLLEYRDRSTPRHEVGDKVYTSTDYPHEETIDMHNEGTYWKTWPRKIYFHCVIAPARGGETPIADVRGVLARLGEDIQRRFAERGVMYVRNYNDGFGLTWQNAYQTDDPAVVEAYCLANEIEFEWKGAGRLRTRQRRQAIATHPATGERVWFNHAAFFHVSSLRPSVREELLRRFPEDDLPYNTRYGDGAAIEPDVLDAVRAAYAAEKILFPWQVGDVLMLDNMSVAHGRQPYEGDRKILVGMADACGQGQATTPDGGRQ